MIDKSYRGEDLIGKRCRVTRRLRNNAGDGVSPATICTIVNVVRGHGFVIVTDVCPHCGQYAQITHVRREDLELIE